MKVPLIDLVAQHRSIRDEVMEAVTQVFERQQFIMGATVEAFEREASDYCRGRHAIGCASGSDALLLALMVLDVGTGDEVITTAYSFFATASAITRLGARPVFVDISPGDFNIDVELIERAITPRTKVIMPVHLYGQCSNMSDLIKLARKYDIPIVEDAAQAIGAEIDGQRAGTMGEVGCFSFFPTKNLGAAGDGGLLLTDDDLADFFLELLVRGAEAQYGRSSRARDVADALSNPGQALAKLGRAPRESSVRRATRTVRSVLGSGADSKTAPGVISTAARGLLEAPGGTRVVRSIQAGRLGVQRTDAAAAGLGSFPRPRRRADSRAVLGRVSKDWASDDPSTGVELDHRFGWWSGRDDRRRPWRRQ